MDIPSCRTRESWISRASIKSTRNVASINPTHHQRAGLATSSTSSHGRYGIVVKASQEQEENIDGEGMKEQPG